MLVQHDCVSPAEKKLENCSSDLDDDAESMQRIYEYTVNSNEGWGPLSLLYRRTILTWQRNPNEERVLLTQSE